jgi:hypothetical protein
LKNYKSVHPPSSSWFVLETLGSKRAYTTRALWIKHFNPSFASQGQIFFSRLCQEKYKGIHPVGISYIDLATLGKYKGVHP